MKLIILDRDGVINQDSKAYIKSPDEWIPIPGSLQAISYLNQSGFWVVVATNQSGLAKGLFDIDTLNAIHRKMQQELSKIGGHIDGIFFCPHGPEAQCLCRKPQPGMLIQASQRFLCEASTILCIGDSLRDIEAAERFGARSALVLTGNGVATREAIQHKKNIAVYNDLAAAVQDLLNG